MKELFNIENENVLIGSILLYPLKLNEVISFLKEEHFYKKELAEIYKAIICLDTDFQEINYLSVSNELKKTNSLVDVIFLIELTQKLNKPVNCVYFSKLIIEDFIKREIFKQTVEARKMLSEGKDIFEIIKKNQSLNETFLNLTSNEKIFKAVKVAENFIEENKKENENAINFQTGFQNIDENLALKSGHLVILAAGTSHGKTVFSLNVARNLAKNNISVGFFSLEMSKTALVNRIISNEISFNNFSFNYKLSIAQVQQYENGIKKIKEYPIYINDFGTLDILKIKAFTKEMIKNYDVKVVIIDYLQLISSTVKKGANREQEVAQITRSLKLLAKDENICIIALSQFSRDFDKQKRRPQLSDMRESGAIEQDADTVILLYNYAKVGIESNGAILIDIAKQRAGKLFETTLDFNGEFQRFTEINNF